MANSFTFQNSFADSSKVYTQAQGRLMGQTLHIQVKGPAGNRSYGASVNVELPQDVANWLGTVANNAESFNQNGTPYASLQLRTRKEYGKLHVQVLGPAHNRDYGASFDVVSTELYDYLS